MFLDPMWQAVTHRHIQNRYIMLNFSSNIPERRASIGCLKTYPLCYVPEPESSFRKEDFALSFFNVQHYLRGKNLLRGFKCHLSARDAMKEACIIETTIPYLLPLTTNSLMHVRYI